MTILILTLLILTHRTLLMVSVLFLLNRDHVEAHDFSKPTAVATPRHKVTSVPSPVLCRNPTISFEISAAHGAELGTVEQMPLCIGREPLALGRESMRIRGQLRHDPRSGGHVGRLVRSWHSTSPYWPRPCCEDPASLA